MALIVDLKITSMLTTTSTTTSSTISFDIGFIKDSIEPNELIKKNKVEEIREENNYKEYFIANKRTMPPFDINVFKYLKCYSGSYIEIYDENKYSIVITFFIIKNPELITEKVIENNNIRQIFAMSSLIINNMINPIYHQYRLNKFIKDIEKNKIMDLSFPQPDYIKTQLWTSQINNILWLINSFHSENYIRFSNNKLNKNTRINLLNFLRRFILYVLEKYCEK
jgi:hypothetical protein